EEFLPVEKPLLPTKGKLANFASIHLRHWVILTTWNSQIRKRSRTAIFMPTVKLPALVVIHSRSRTSVSSRDLHPIKLKGLIIPLVKRKVASSTVLASRKSRAIKAIRTDRRSTCLFPGRLSRARSPLYTTNSVLSSLCRGTPRAIAASRHVNTGFVLMNVKETLFLTSNDSIASGLRRVRPCTLKGKVILPALPKQNSRESGRFEPHQTLDIYHFCVGRQNPLLFL